MGVAVFRDSDKGLEITFVQPEDVDAGVRDRVMAIIDNYVRAEPQSSYVAPARFTESPVKHSKSSTAAIETTDDPDDVTYPTSTTVTSSECDTSKPQDGVQPTESVMSSPSSAAADFQTIFPQGAGDRDAESDVHVETPVSEDPRPQDVPQGSLLPTEVPRAGTTMMSDPTTQVTRAGTTMMIRSVPSNPTTPPQGASTENTFLRSSVPDLTSEVPQSTAFLPTELVGEPYSTEVDSRSSTSVPETVLASTATGPKSHVALMRTAHASSPSNPSNSSAPVNPTVGASNKQSPGDSTAFATTPRSKVNDIGSMHAVSKEGSVSRGSFVSGLLIALTLVILKF